MQGPLGPVEGSALVNPKGSAPTLDSISCFESGLLLGYCCFKLGPAATGHTSQFDELPVASVFDDMYSSKFSLKGLRLAAHTFVQPHIRSLGPR